MILAKYPSNFARFIMRKKISVILIMILILTFFTNTVFANVYEISNEKGVIINESITITKGQEDVVKDFRLSGTLVNGFDFLYNELDSYLIHNYDNSSYVDNNDNVLFDITTKDFVNNKINYNIEIKEKVYNVNYFIDPESININQVYPENVKVFLNPSDKIESNNPSIVEMSNQIVGKEQNPYKKAKLIFDFTYMYMDYDLSQGNNSALNALNTRIGVCEDYSRLMVSLLRAQGIPARTVSGYRLPHDATVVEITENSPYAHMWVEFYLSEYGWIPADPTITFSGEKFITNVNFASMTEYYIPITIEKPLFKQYNYKTVRGSKPNIQVNVNTTVQILDKVEYNNYQSILPTTNQNIDNKPNTPTNQPNNSTNETPSNNVNYQNNNNYNQNNNQQNGQVNNSNQYVNPVPNNSQEDNVDEQINLLKQQIKVLNKMNEVLYIFIPDIQNKDNLTKLLLSNYSGKFLSPNLLIRLN